MLGEETLHVLQTARESASQIKIRAEEGAARILREATEDANRTREQAEIEASRKRTDAAADAEGEVSLAKQQGREMVNEARAYRERVLSELTRRRELARQQIEQLILGRDRLLQVFERARLVAVDVVAELTPLGEPEEYVDLSPTTGPVPMMVPARSLTGAVRRGRHRDGRRRRTATPTTPRSRRRCRRRARSGGRPSDRCAETDDGRAAERRGSKASWMPADDGAGGATDVAHRRPPTTRRRRPSANVVELFPGKADDARPIPTPAHCSPACGPARRRSPPTRLAATTPTPKATAPTRRSSTGATQRSCR